MNGSECTRFRLTRAYFKAFVFPFSSTSFLFCFILSDASSPYKPHTCQTPYVSSVTHSRSSPTTTIITTITTTTTLPTLPLSTSQVTTIADALSLHKALEAKEEGKWDRVTDEEYEDADGNVYNKKTYEDLRKQGLI